MHGILRLRVRVVIAGGLGFGVVVPAFGSLLMRSCRAFTAQHGQTRSRVEPHGIAIWVSVPVSRSSTRRISGRPQTPWAAPTSRAIAPVISASESASRSGSGTAAIFGALLGELDSQQQRMPNELFDHPERCHVAVLR